jgi:hypothetical protein
MEKNSFDLPRLFGAVADRLSLERETLNGADPVNHDHGDHMVEIFQVATQAAAAFRRGSNSSAGENNADLAGAMEYAAELLQLRSENGSAQVYARGLAQLAGQFRQRGIGLEDLAPYVQRTLQKQVTGADLPESSPAKSPEVLKALLNALAGWEKVEAGGPAPSGDPANGDAGGGSGKGNLDLGYLFGVGMSYLQARQKGGDALDILSETVVSASPLAGVPHRYQSGKIALRALLEAMGNLPA